MLLEEEVVAQMGIMVSFCITVYNQSELVQKCINSIVEYKGRDIEVIISDDRSSEDIKSLADSYHDSRIKYFLNETNLGHDRNIVNALSKASGRYAFLLRTRDLMIPGAIPLLVKAAEKGDASYITGEAVNQDGDLKIRYTKDCFRQGGEAIDANYKLFIHPSGNMYRLADFSCEEMRTFLDNNEVPKNGFIVHNLIRLKLATTGDFRLIEEPVWVYTDTERAEDRAVNKSTGGVSVYDPLLIEKRYQYEVKWARQILETEDYRKVFYLLTALYLDQATWGFKLTNSDKRSQHHYDYQEIQFSVSKQRNRFRRLCDDLYDEHLGEPKTVFDKNLDHLFFRNRTSDAIKYAARKLTYGTRAYHAAARIYKKYIKGL